VDKQSAFINNSYIIIMSDARYDKFCVFVYFSDRLVENCRLPTFRSLKKKRKEFNRVLSLSQLAVFIEFVCELTFESGPV